MGDCYSKENKKDREKSRQHKRKHKDKHEIRESSRQLRQFNRSFLAIEKGHTLKFTHTPLSASEFLQNKFRNNPSEPSQVELTFMLVGLEVSTEKNEIRMQVTNLNQVNIYVVVGGEEKINNTGLTIQITKGKYAEAVRKRPSGKDKVDQLLVVPKKLEEKPIYIVFEPQNKTVSTFLMYRYIHDHGSYKKASATLMLSSLSFNLNDIYGSDDLFKAGSGQQCSVCISSPANMILNPCRHMCMCQGCARILAQKSRKCPICRTEYISSIKYGDDRDDDE